MRVPGTLVALGALICLVVLLTPPGTVVGQAEPEVAAAEDEFVELATYMNRLQTLTHKLALSVEHSNHRLAKFYLYESLEALKDIKTDVPEYRGLPIALLIDQLSTEKYAALELAIQADEVAPGGAGEKAKSPAAFAAVIQSCNQCHEVTQHGFIKVPSMSGGNPFLQDFKRSKP